jgi:hypothetical protein
MLRIATFMWTGHWNYPFRMFKKAEMDFQAAVFAAILKNVD